VLGDFSQRDSGWVDDFLGAICAYADLLVAGADATFQNRVHEAMVPHTDAPASEEDS
jgi:hypothetical protein